MLGQSLLKKFVPKSIEPILNLVGPSFFKAIPWAEMAKEGGALLKHLSEGDSAAKAQVFSELSQLLGTQGVQLVAKPGQLEWPKDVEQRQALGEKLLRFYFTQLKNPQGIFLDLRPARFAVQGDQLVFAPDHLWIKMEEGFRQGLRDMYAGFYGDDLETFDKGLGGLGLLKPNMASEDKARIRQVFFERFGSGDQTAVEFSAQQFLEASEGLFGFILDQKLQISGQYLHLGIYLASLYMVLQNLGVPLNVRRAYLEAQID